MSFREKSAFITLLAGVIAFAFYGHEALAGGLETGSLKQLITAMIIFVVLLVAGQILVAALKPKEADLKDERDDRIGLRAEAVSTIVVAIALIWIAGLGVAREQWLFVHLAFAGLLGGELIKALTQLILYRT